MEKYIVNQDCSVIRHAADCMPIQRVGNVIYGIDYSMEDDIQAAEDTINRGMKKHIVELGIYDSEDSANVVMIFLIRWLKGIVSGTVFIMPGYDEKIVNEHDALIYKSNNLLEEFGKVDR